MGDYLFSKFILSISRNTSGRSRTDTPVKERDFESRASANSATLAINIILEAATGFEPVIKVLQTSALPLGYAAIILSGRRDSNPRPSPWQGDILPLNYFRKASWATRIRT